ncbi:MAG: PDZ domain-containing protein [Alphaproteobacteria bacterium]|nr:PDZ domain-containing protein [Alphaproteobacteria bacterium]
MGYQLLSVQDARTLPRNQGSLGMDVERATQITDSGLTFDTIRVKQVRRGSAGAQAGFHSGDQIIAIDGHVFASLMTFASYIGSLPPGSQASVDYIPAGGGPEKAERVVVTLAATGRPVQSAPQNSTSDTASSGMSTRTKIGIAAVALFGCYEFGCFKHTKPINPLVNSQPQLSGVQQR